MYRIYKLLWFFELVVSNFLNRNEDYYYEIKKLWIASQPTFGGNRKLFYQTHPELDLMGVRPTISRLKNYELFSYISSESVCLDLGSNTGFFSLYLSNYVKSVNLVELNSNFCKIAELTIDYLKIKNCIVSNSSILDFKDQQKYNLIISTAVHRYLKIAIQDYFQFLADLLTPSGIVLFETHFNENINEIENEIPFFFSIQKKGIIDDHLGQLRTFFILKLNRN